MAYEIKLLIDGEKKTYVRNEPPMLIDMTNAMKYQAHQIKMYNKKDGLTDKDLDQQQKDFAMIASSFWHKQFSEKAFITGADQEAMDVLYKVIGDSLGTSDDEEQSADKSDDGKADRESARTN